MALRGTSGSWAWALGVAWGVGCGGASADRPTPDVPDRPVAAPEPGPAATAPLRLTVRQIQRSLDALTGVTVSEALAWPTDPTRRGLAGQEEVASVSGALVDALDGAAAAAAAAWSSRVRGPVVTRVEAEGLGADLGCALAGEGAVDEVWWLMWRVEPLHIAVDAPVDGTYVIRLRARHRTAQFGFSGSTIRLDLDGAPVWGWDLEGEADPVVVEAEVQLRAGAHTLALALPGGLTAAREASSYSVHGMCAEGNAVGYDWVEVRGPRDVASVPCRPAAPLPAIAGLPQGGAAVDVERCAAGALAPLARRAWRREPSAEAVGRLVGVATAAAEEGLGWEEALGEAVRAMVLSPRFVARVEPSEAGPRSLDGWELAERLALTVWGSLPDDALLDCAASGALVQEGGPCGLIAQVERVLGDPRAVALTEDFASGWLGLDQLGVDDLPEGGDEALVAAMRAETLDLFDALLTSPDASALRLLDAPAARWAEPLAGWLGADGADRRGVLGHAGILSLTSEPWRTSPVRRGVFVLDRLMCAAPSAPPPSVPALAGAPGDAPGDLVAALAAHRADPACAACHDDIDPLGLALEGFGPGGRARPVDPGVTGYAPDGAPLPDVAALSAWLVAQPRVDRCLTARLAGYALGREVQLDDVDDAARVAAWSATWAEGSWSDRVRAVLLSRAFREIAPRSAPEVAP